MQCNQRQILKNLLNCVVVIFLNNRDDNAIFPRELVRVNEMWENILNLDKKQKIVKNRTVCSHYIAFLRIK